MAKAKLILIIAFVITLVAGVAAGFAVRPFFHIHQPPPHNRFPDLKLTAEQAAKMHEIWDAVMRSSRETQNKQRQAFLKERDEAIRAMLTQEQKAKYDEILKDYSGEIAELGKAREKAFQEAVEKTKLILNAEQQKKYEEWLKNWREERRPGGPPPEEMPSHGRAPGQPSPATQSEPGHTTAPGSGA
jgi:Spy/CpxP family protein refolding chaperone